MSRELKMFFIGISNAFRSDGYSNIVDQPKRLGEVSTKVNKRLGKKYKKVYREYDEQISRIRTY